MNKRAPPSLVCHAPTRAPTSTPTPSLAERLAERTARARDNARRAEETRRAAALERPERDAVEYFTAMVAERKSDVEERLFLAADNTHSCATIVEIFKGKYTGRFLGEPRDMDPRHVDAFWLHFRSVTKVLSTSLSELLGVPVRCTEGCYDEPPDNFLAAVRASWPPRE